MKAKLLTPLIGLWLAGCASGSLVSSYPVGSTLNKGIIYSLPKQLVEVEYEKSLVSEAEAATKLSAARTAFQTAETAMNTKKGEVAVVQKFIENIDSSASGYEAVKKAKQSELLSLKTQLLILTSSWKTKREGFYAAIDLHANAQENGSTSTETLKFKALAPIPDERYQLVAKINHAKRFSDSLSLTVKDGLLDGAIGSTDDKGDQIVSALVGGLSGLGFGSRGFSKDDQNNLWAGGDPITNDDNSPKVKCPKSLKVSMIIDPDDPSSLEILNAALKPCISIQVANPPPSNAITEHYKVRFKTGVDGLVYRHPGIYTLNVYRGELSEGNGIRVERLELAQGGAIGFVDFPKSSFAKNEFDIKFSKGALTKANYTLPSETLGFVSILPNALRAIFAIPTELIKLKVDYSSQEIAMAQNQVSMLKALAEIDAQQALLEAD